MDIIDYPNYLIYDDGRVYSKNKNIFMKTRLDIHGYHKVNLYNGKKKTFRIHRLVALHYLDSVEGKNQIDHIDRDKSNNNVSNLRWCNNTENQHNTGIQSNNKLGIKFISKTNHDTYIFRISRQNDNHSKTFKTLDECIEYRDNYLNSN